MGLANHWERVLRKMKSRDSKFINYLFFWLPTWPTLNAVSSFITFIAKVKVWMTVLIKNWPNHIFQLRISNELDIPIEDKKTEGPSTCITLLGIELDTMAMEMHLPNSKLSQLKQVLVEKKAVRKWPSISYRNFVTCVQGSSSDLSAPPNYLIHSGQVIGSLCQIHQMCSFRYRVVVHLQQGMEEGVYDVSCRQIYPCRKIDNNNAYLRSKSFVSMLLCHGKVELHSWVQLADSQSGFTTISRPNKAARMGSGWACGFKDLNNNTLFRDGACAAMFFCPLMWETNK